MIDFCPESRLIFDVPRRLTDVGDWHEHIPFAFWLVEQARPRLLVELGTHKGDSFCAFCQAVDKLRLPTRCRAVDTWRDDPQAGFHGQEVLEELREHHDPRYGRFSRLVRSTFDEALDQFAVGSIDLLHIDGLHTYEAVRHDFESWSTRLSDRAIVLLHDTNVREGDFGVWRFWDELRERVPSFTFLHGRGLGVAAVGPQCPPEVSPLFAGDSEQAAAIRSVFSTLGRAAGRAREEGLLRRVPVAETATREGAEARAAALESEAALGAERAARQSAEARAAILETEAAERLAQTHASTRYLFASWGRAMVRRWPRTSLAFLVPWWALTFRLRERQRLRRSVRTLRRSGLFDVGYYLLHCPEVLSLQMDPAVHYLTRGAEEGHNPGPVFDTRWYLEQNPEVRLSGENPLLHYLRVGAREGRQPIPHPESLPEQELPSSRSEPEEARPDPATPGSDEPAATGNDEAGDVPATTAPPVAETTTGSQGGPRPDPAAVARIASRARGKEPAILVVDHRLPHPDMDSSSVRMLELVKLAAELGHRLTFVSDHAERQPRYERALKDLGVNVLYGAEATGRHLRREGGRYRWALLSRPHVGLRYAPLVRAFALFADLIYDTVDLHWVRLRRGAEVSGDPELARQADEHFAAEGVCIGSADLVLAITDEERRKILETWPQARVEVVPNVHECRPLPRRWADRRDLLFIGGYEHVPNVDAVGWFAREVMPLVRRELPDVRFRMVGSKPPPELAALVSPSVELVGWVPDPDPIFDAARVFVAPLRYGAGMKGKVGQAMSLGLPVVTTGIGAEGMLLEDGVHALLADEPAAFAQAVVRLYQDETLWKRLREGSLAHVDRHFSRQAVARIVSSRLFPDRSRPVRHVG